MQKDKFQLARRNTIKTLLIVGCGLIICWTQNQVLYLLHNLGYPVDFNGTYFQYTVLMGFLNCTVNPFIYLAQYRDYQMALKLFLRCNTEISKHSDGNNQPSYIFNSNSTRSDLTSNQWTTLPRQNQENKTILDVQSNQWLKVGCWRLHLVKNWKSKES